MTRRHRLLPGVALLVELGGALLLVNGLLDSPGDADALHLGDVVAFFLILLLAPFLDVIGSLAVLAVLEAALLTGDGLLHRPLGDLALTLLDFSADGVGDVMALPSSDGVVNGLGHLLTDLLRDLTADGRSITLERDLSQGQEKRGDDDDLHVETLGCTDNKITGGSYSDFE